MDNGFQSDRNRFYQGSRLLASTEEGLYGYNRDIVKKIVKGFGNPPSQILREKRVLDFGAGLGALAFIWRDLFGVIPVCVELDPMQKKFLETKGFSCYTRIEETGSLFSYIYCSNVLEHVEDDVLLLSQIRQGLTRDGLLAIYVPALPFLYSDFDVSVGHFRRYSKKELVEKVQNAGFEVKSCIYNDVFGIFGSLFIKLLGKKGLKIVNSTSTLGLFDKIIYPFSRIFDQLLFRRIIGKNVLLIAAVNQK